jgi:hypothetical protein
MPIRQNDVLETERMHRADEHVYSTALRIHGPFNARLNVQRPIGDLDVDVHAYMFNYEL